VVGRSRSGCDPGFDLGSRRPFVRRGGPPRGGSSLRASPTRPPRCLPRELLRPTSPDDFCSFSRPADVSANPDPCRHPAERPCGRRPASCRRAPRRSGGRPSAGGSEEAERRSRPRITISPEHRLSSPLPRPGLGKASRSRRPGTVLAASRGDRGLVFHTVARTSDVAFETGCLPSSAPDDGFPCVGSDRETMLLRAIAPGRRLCHHPERRS